MTCGMHVVTCHYAAEFLLYEGKASRLEVQLLQPKQLYRLEFKARQALPPKGKKPAAEDV